MGRRDRHALSEGWHARPEIHRDAIDEASQVDWLLAGRSPNSLEPVCDAFESLEIRLHVIERGQCHGLWLRFPQQLYPTADAGQRSAQLVRRFASHSRP